MAMEEARPPHREASISGFLRRCDGSFTLKFRWVWWIADRVCAAWGGRTLAEELVLLLVLVAGRDFWRGSSLVTTAQFSSGLFGSSPNLWWWCSVLLCKLLVCVVCVVVFASACYVKLLLLLLKWWGSAPAFYLKKMWGLEGGHSTVIAEMKRVKSSWSGERTTLDPVVWTSLGPLPRWVPGSTTRWAPGTTRLALHGTCWRETQGLRRRSTRIGSCTCPALYRGLLDVLD
jgi:hypothetical protein